MKIGFIGAGNMAGAIIRGMVGGGFRGSDILIYDTDSAKMVALFEECGVSICSSGVLVAGLLLARPMLDRSEPAQPCGKGGSPV